MKQLNGFSGLYFVTEDGRIWYAASKRFAVLGRKANGYFHVGLLRDGKRKNFYVHRLVAETFLPNPKGLPEVNHLDGNKLNNHVENLEWCTSSHNIQHAYTIGARRPTRMVGQNNPASKLKDSDVVEIRKLLGTLSARKIAAKFKVSQPLVSLIGRRMAWKHVN